jgi:hypothetical protein
MDLIFRMHLASFEWSAIGGFPISMRGSHLSLGVCEQHTTRTTIVLAFWQIYVNDILIMFGTS